MSGRSGSAPAKNLSLEIAADEGDIHMAVVFGVGDEAAVFGFEVDDQADIRRSAQQLHAFGNLLADVDGDAASGNDADLLVRSAAIAEKSYSSRVNCGLRRSISRNFLGSKSIIDDARDAVTVGAHGWRHSQRYSGPCPEMTDITAISVVVARIIPSSVRKLRSLLPRSEWSAPSPLPKTMHVNSFSS